MGLLSWLGNGVNDAEQWLGLKQPTPQPSAPPIINRPAPQQPQLSVGVAQPQQQLRVAAPPPQPQQPMRVAPMMPLMMRYNNVNIPNTTSTPAQPLPTQLQNARYGVLANNPAAQQQLLNNSAPSHFNPVTAGAGAAYGYLKNIPAGVVNAAQVPYDLARVGVGNLAMDQQAAQAGRQALGSDVGNNLFSPDVPFLKSVTAAGLNKVSNNAMNQQADYAQRVLGKAYTTNPQTGAPLPNAKLGQNNASLDASQIKQGFLQDQLNRAGLNMNDSTAKTALKIGAQGGQFFLNNVMLANMGNALAGQAGFGGLNNALNRGYTPPALPTPGAAPTGLIQRAAPFIQRAGENGGLNAASNMLGVAQTGSKNPMDYVKAGATGVAQGALLSAGSDLAGHAVAAGVKGYENRVPLSNQIGAIGKNVNQNPAHEAIKGMSQAEVKNLMQGNYGNPESSAAAASRTKALVDKGLIAPTKDGMTSGAFRNTHEVTQLGAQVHAALTDPNGALPIGVHPAETAKPTPNQIWGDSYMQGTYKGKPYTTNGYILDLNKVQDQPGFGKTLHKVGNEAPTSDGIDTIMKNASGKVSVKPSEFQPSAKDGSIYGLANPTLILRNGDHAVGVQPQYYNYFKAKYGDNISVNYDPQNPLNPLRVSVGNKTVGLLMPLKGSEARLPAESAKAVTSTPTPPPKTEATGTQNNSSTVGNVVTNAGHTPHDLINMAHAQKDEFLAHTQDIAAQHGGTVTDKTLGNAVKTDVQRIAQKIVDRNGAAPTDILRTTIHHPDPAGIHQQIIDAYKSKGYDVYNHPVTGQPDITNRYAEPGGGYKDVAIKLVKPGAPDHIVKEVQLISPEMARAKGEEQGHALYKVGRNPDANNPARINAISDKIYARAAQAEANRLNPSRVISLPSETSLSKGTSAPLSDTARTLSEPNRSNLTGAPSTSKNLGKVDSSAGVSGNRTDIPSTIAQKAGNVKERGLTTGIKNSPEFSPKLQKAVSSEYTPFTNKAATATTAEFMKQPLDQAKQQVMETLAQGQGHHLTGASGNARVQFGKQEVSNAGAVIKALDAKGDIQGAQAVHDLLAAKLTNAGQTGQAASLIYNRTPEGMKFMAQRELTNAHIPISPELKAQMDQHIAAIKAAPDGSREQNYAIGKFHQLVGSQIPTSVGTKLLSLYKTGILSSPKTAVKVGIVNPLTSALETAKDVPAAAVDRALSLATGKRSMVAPDLRNTGAAIHAIPNAARDAGIRFKDNIVMPGSSGLGIDELSSVGPRAQGANFGVSKNGGRTVLDQLTHGASSKILNGYTSSIGRVHGALQTVPFETRAAQSLMQSAEAEALNQGLKGAAKTDFINQYVANPPKAAYERSQLDAQYATSQQKTALGQAASGIQHTLPGGQIIAPITRIPGAVATQVFNYSPLGFAKTPIQALMDARAGRPFDQAGFSRGIGRAVTGTALMAGGAALAAQGRISGAYPKDKATQTLWVNANIPANSVYVGGKAYPNQPWKNTGGTWQQISSPGGAGAQALLTGGAAYNGYKQGGTVQAALQGGQGAAQIITNQPYLTGVSGAMGAINTPNQAKTFLDQTAGSVVPNFVRDYAQATDPLQRQTSVSNPVTSMKNAITNGIPGLREKNLPQVDLYGNSIPRNGGVAGALLNPFNPQSSRTSDLTNALGTIHNVQDVNGKPLSIPDQLNKSVTIAGQNGQKIKLSDAQRTGLIQTSGQAAYNQANAFIHTPAFQLANPSQQSKMLGDIFSGQRNLAETKIPGSGVKLDTNGKAIVAGRSPTIDPHSQKVTVTGKYSLPKNPNAKPVSHNTTTTYDQKSNTWTQTNSKTGRVVTIAADGTRTVVNAGIRIPRAKTASSRTSTGLSGVRVSRSGRISAPRIKGVSAMPRLAKGSSYKPPKFKVASAKAPKFKVAPAPKVATTTIKLPSFAVKSSRVNRKALA